MKTCFSCPFSFSHLHKPSTKPKFLLFSSSLLHRWHETLAPIIQRQRLIYGYGGLGRSPAAGGGEFRAGGGVEAGIVTTIMSVIVLGKRSNSIFEELHHHSPSQSPFDTSVSKRIRCSSSSPTHIRFLPPRPSSQSLRGLILRRISII